VEGQQQQQRQQQQQQQTKRVRSNNHVENKMCSLLTVVGRIS
jgi:hypothetical protein